MILNGPTRLEHIIIIMTIAFSIQSTKSVIFSQPVGFMSYQVNILKSEMIISSKIQNVHICESLCKKNSLILP